MSAPRLQSLRPAVSRAVRVTVTALTLSSFLLSDMPVSFAVPSENASPPQLPGCCAARLAAKEQSTRNCGCSAKNRSTGSCCCQGRPVCGRTKRGADDERKLCVSSCDCGGFQAKSLAGVQPRIKSESLKLTGAPSLEMLSPAPRSNPDSLEFEPETPPPRHQLCFWV